VAWLYERLGRVLAERPGCGPDHVVADFLLTLVAGHESVAHALATLIVHGFAWDPNGRPDPFSHGVDAALHEALRFDAPVQMLGRVAGERGVSLPDGRTAPPGVRIYLHLGAANRDPQRFEQPDVFDPGRTSSALAFGTGAARCVGRALAMQAMRCFVEAMHEQGAELVIDRKAIARDGGLSGRAFAVLPAVLARSARHRRRASPPPNEDLTP
jgi:cytochrome P450